MAKYTVEHACGHSQAHQLFGPGRDRDRKIAWLETTTCSDCTSRNIQDEAARIAADDRAEELPELVGSEKQVAWATTIRAQVLVSAGEYMIGAEAKVAESRRAGKVEDADQAEVILGKLGEALYLLRRFTAARFWIDHRAARGRSILDSAIEALAREGVAR